jgi:hypothetical protein
MHFPVLLRLDDWAEARVRKEQAEALLLENRADLESAKAEAIRAKTQLRLAGLNQSNRDLLDTLAGDPSEHSRHAAVVATTIAMEDILRRMHHLGIQVSIATVPDSLTEHLPSQVDGTEGG